MRAGRAGHRLKRKPVNPTTLEPAPIQSLESHVNDVVLGAIVGGSITIIASLINHSFQAWRFKEEVAVDKTKRAEERSVLARERRLERFADFLSAYYGTDGRLRDLCELVTTQRPGWNTQFLEILDSEAHQLAVSRLNAGRAWVAMLAVDGGLRSRLDELSRHHERLMSELLVAQASAVAKQPIEPDVIESCFSEVESAFEVVVIGLRSDVASEAG